MSAPMILTAYDRQCFLSHVPISKGLVLWRGARSELRDLSASVLKIGSEEVDAYSAICTFGSSKVGGCTSPGCGRRNCAAAGRRVAARRLYCCRRQARLGGRDR